MRNSAAGGRLSGARLHAVAALAAGAIAITAVVLGVRRIACAEADVSSFLIHLTGLANSRPIGTAVIYQIGSRWEGFAITGGCSVAMLMIPPFGLSALLIGLRRVSWGRGAVASVCAAALLVAVNQIRLYVIAGSMKWWGFQTGYERSHVLIGSGITTIGMALVTILFLIFLSRQRRRPALRPARRARHAA